MGILKKNIDGAVVIIMLPRFLLYYKFVHKIFTSWIIYRHVLFVLLIENINDWHCLKRCLMVCAKRRMQVALTGHTV